MAAGTNSLRSSYQRVYQPLSGLLAAALPQVSKLYMELPIILGAVMVLLSTSGSTECQHIQPGVITHYGEIGSNITLSCDMSASGTADWRLNDSRIMETTDVKQMGNKLIIINAHSSKEGEYSCHSPETGSAYSRVSLLLGYAPGKPQLNCYSASYPLNMTCSWKLEKPTNLPTVIKTTYSYGTEQHVKTCSSTESLQDSCTIEDIKLFSKVPYTVKVTATNPLGSRSTTKEIIVEKIIKPDPPADVSLSPIPNQRKKLLLQWKPPVTWPNPQLFLLKYIIKYWQAGSDRPRMIEISNQTSYTLSGLRSRAVYFVAVAAKDFVDNGQPSEWSPTVSARLWSKE
ncbi:interleukin-27 subunit beta-like [Pristis pectinata]|uniref:interleukin-27 subunit beta-like n=1 Tax=Pristis pectinata TaxID=685728 RepID=UPI00223E1A48|nr:interleukin-27 subunit beta-like [Pristis pectinata]